MRFESLHPTDVHDEQAELIFLALATKWDDIETDDLAIAFAGASVYIGQLPRAFGAHLTQQTMGDKCGVLVERLDFDPFRLLVTDQQCVNLMVVAACDRDALAQQWDNPRAQYHPDERLIVRGVAMKYEQLHGESHTATLRRAVEKRDA